MPHCVLIFTKAPVGRKEDRRDEDLPTVKENSAISCNIRVLLSTVELSLHPLSSHEVESVRKEKERLTAASAALSFPFMYTSLDWKVSLLSFMVPFSRAQLKMKEKGRHTRQLMPFSIFN